MTFLSRLPLRRKPVVPLVRLSGQVGVRSRVPGVPAFSAQGLAPVLDKAFATPRARAVALAINSPGGSPVQCALLSSRIRMLADQHSVPVCAFIEDIAASGGYWLACAADEIFANGASIVGSIGVINAGFGLHRVLDRLGIERRVHAVGKHKGMLDPFQVEDAGDVAILDAILEDMQDQFVTMVKKSRGSRLRGEDEEIFNAGVWSGRRALELGLIDGIADPATLLRERFGDQVRIRDLTPRKRWFWQATPAAWIDAAFERLEERSLFARYGL